jgi:1-acyl-sn-glycerol-3-phosphate acyltransferase
LRLLRIPFRLMAVLWRLCVGYWLIRVRFPRLNNAQRSQTVQTWSRQMLRAFGISLHIEGEAPQEGPLLLVANHLSWLDILVVHAARHCRFVSKAEVHHWPLIGAMANAGGTLFIERASRRDAMRVVHHMAESLERGDMLAIFPEGTTGDGSALLPFHANLIQAAISANAPVMPLGLRYVQSDGQPSRAVLYIGDDTLVGSVLRTLGAPAFSARVRFGLAQLAEGRDRRQWAHDLHATVARLCA